jgi:hypothetical protein
MNKTQNIWIFLTSLVLAGLGFLLHSASAIVFFYKKDLFYSTLAILSLSIFFAAIYLVFIRLNAEGKTDWHANLQRAGSRNKKLALIAFSFIFWPMFSLSVGFVLTDIPAIPCDKFSAQSFSTAAVVTGINNTGRTPGALMRLSIHFKEEDYSSSFKWIKSDIDSQSIKESSTITIHGRSCSFGYVVEKITRTNG